MRRRQFLQGAAAIAAVVVAPFIKPEEWCVSWWDKYTMHGERHIAELRIINTGRFMSVDFAEIEKRVAAHLIHDGEFHQYGYNSNGQVFFDGKQV